VQLALAACNDVLLLHTYTGTLSLPRGHWRENMTQIYTRTCWNENACVGGIAAMSSSDLMGATTPASILAASNSYCARGYTGPCK
jgi:hypothetical protein